MGCSTSFTTSSMSFAKSTAFLDVITGFPVSASRACLAIPATRPPRRAMLWFSSKVVGFSSLDMSVVEVYASIFKISSVVLMLSRRFCFFKPFSFLYCCVFIPDQARVISLVKIAYSLPCVTPLSCHSSVSSLRTWIACNRWFIHSRVYPFCRYVARARSIVSSG